MQLGRLLYNICCVVPGGVVAFAPSFSYAAKLVERWKASGALARIDAR
jgi:Rad3-related DNA helicase